MQSFLRAGTVSSSLTVLVLLPALVVAVFASCVLAGSPRAATLAAVRAIDPLVVPEEDRAAARDMVYNHQMQRRREFNDRSTANWHRIETTADWETFRNERIERLRRTLNVPATRPALPTVHVTGTLPGDGFIIRKLVFASRPGIQVSANLYLPAEKPAEESSTAKSSRPGILIVHSHHRPKEHAELQDMGMTWARAGCAVLVPDLIGYGERRQHRFASSADYDGEFRVSRQDYFFRYDNGVRLHLAGSSLMAWFAHDLMCCVDVLLAQPGVDDGRIAILGSVAGGGDPAAVTAALDRRIDVAVPFNFGGPQPENRFPLPADSDRSFNYAGGAYWDTARNLRRSAVDGFMPWVLVGATAPRGLIYAHEFAWDRQRDPVWRRYGILWSKYNAADRLGFTHGRGSVRGRPPEATHCTHIGREHRKMIHPLFRRWLGINVTTDSEYSKPLNSELLHCFTGGLREKLPPGSLSNVLPETAGQALAAARQVRGRAASPRESLQRDLQPLLGEIAPAGKPNFVEYAAQAEAGDDDDMTGAVRVRRGQLQVEPGISVPLIVLASGAGKDEGQRPVVVAVAQAGKAGFLQHRAGEIARLLDGGCLVVLCDLRGTGETRLNDSRSPYSNLTSRTCTEFMLGGTIPGSQLKDLRTVIAWVREQKGVDPRRIALWGESFAASNSLETLVDVPRRIDGEPAQSEPGGMLLSLLAAVYDEQLAAVSVSGGVLSFVDVLRHSRVQIPHDVVIPGLLNVADVVDLLQVCSRQPVRLSNLVDAGNRAIPAKSAIAQLHASGLKAVDTAGGRSASAESSRLTVANEGDETVVWLLEQLRPAE